MHCGSIYGLVPPGFTVTDAQAGPREIMLNVGQKYLWECWKHFCGEMKKETISALVFLGDCIDGKQRKDEGGELCLNRCSEQSRAASVAAKMLRHSCGDPQTYVIKGTPYHSGVSGDEEQRFANKIGAGRALEFLDLNVDGVIINFLHGISVAGGLYRETPVGREAVWSALAGKDGRALKCDCFVRAHAHFFLHVEHRSKHGVVNPCWKLQDAYSRKNSMYRMLPEIGGTLITIDSDAKRQKLDPISVRKIMYDLPEPKATRLPL